MLNVTNWAVMASVSVTVGTDPDVNETGAGRRYHWVAMRAGAGAMKVGTYSGNGIAAFALQRLGFLLGETRYLDAAERTLRAAWRAIDEYPHGHVSLLNALEEYRQHPEIIVIRGEDKEIRRWRDSAAKVYAPRRLVFAVPASESGLPGALADRKAMDGETVAYRCLGTHCEMPVTKWEALADQLTDVQG